MGNCRPYAMSCIPVNSHRIIGLDFRKFQENFEFFNYKKIKQIHGEFNTYLQKNIDLFTSPDYFYIPN